LRLFHKNVTLLLALSEFARTRLIEAGFQANRIVVLPNMAAVEHQGLMPDGGRYVAFAGRISEEKGIDTLIRAARHLPELEIRLAGDGPLLPNMIRKAPSNMKFLGRMESQGIRVFYQNARFLVVPSKWFEMCPLVIMEAMNYGLPVVAPKVGGLPELVEDGVTGLLFEPGNSEDLANKMRSLWENSEASRRMGQTGQKKAIREYSEDIYYERLLAAYAKAIEINKNGNDKYINLTK
jgi:glycosyltransferase involved in cell wall biosynthesis